MIAWKTSFHSKERAMWQDTAEVIARLLFKEYERLGAMKDGNSVWHYFAKPYYGRYLLTLVIDRNGKCLTTRKVVSKTYLDNLKQKLTKEGCHDR